jgi:broad-specificity NMP kinase
MPLIYITGIPGTGKSTVRGELLRQGYKALGGAEDDIAAFYDNQTSQRINRWVPAIERTSAWLSDHTWKITRSTMEGLRKKAEKELIYICAVTANDEDELWDLFDKVFALTIDEQTLRHRLATRTNNDVGKISNELESILARQKLAKQKYKELGATIIDATQPIKKVVEDILDGSI